MNNNIITNGKQPLHAYSQALTNLNLRTKQQIQTDQHNTKKCKHVFKKHESNPQNHNENSIKIH